MTIGGVTYILRAIDFFSASFLVDKKVFLVLRVNHPTNQTGLMDTQMQKNNKKTKKKKQKNQTNKQTPHTHTNTTTTKTDTESCAAPIGPKNGEVGSASFVGFRLPIFHGRL